MFLSSSPTFWKCSTKLLLNNQNKIQLSPLLYLANIGLSILSHFRATFLFSWVLGMAISELSQNTESFCGKLLLLEWPGRFLMRVVIIHLASGTVFFVFFAVNAVAAQIGWMNCVKGISKQAEMYSHALSQFPVWIGNLEPGSWSIKYKINLR